jgi:hypothetical protein
MFKRRPVRGAEAAGDRRPVEADQQGTAGLPLTHRLVRLPHVSRRTRRILGPIDSLVVDG